MVSSGLADWLSSPFKTAAEFSCRLTVLAVVFLCVCVVVVPSPNKHRHIKNNMDSAAKLVFSYSASPRFALFLSVLHLRHLGRCGHNVVPFRQRKKSASDNHGVIGIFCSLSSRGPS